MPLPTTNTTADVYRSTTSILDPPDVAGLPGYLRCMYPQGYEAGEGGSAVQITHILDVVLASDIRDGGQTPGSPGADTVFIPDKNGTSFDVIFVGKMGDLRRCWLRRKALSYPSTNL